MATVKLDKASRTYPGNDSPSVEDLASHVRPALAAGHRLLAVDGKGLAQPGLYGQTDDQGHDEAHEIQIERTHDGDSPRLRRDSDAINEAKEEGEHRAVLR